jgi:hypothetical protein
MDGPINPARQQSSAPAYEAAASRTGSRARLAAAIEELTAAGAELAAVQQPASRLSEVVAEATRLEVELVALRAADEQELGAWLAAGGLDLRPPPSPATIAGEARRSALAGDAAAARAALPLAEQAFQRCAANVRELQRRRDEALSLAAIDAARSFAADYQAALTAALEQEAMLHGLRDELSLLGNRADAPPGVLDAAAQIGQLITETKRTAAVRHNPEAARRLLAALVADPDARL